MSEGMVSIVAHAAKPEHFLVRARLRGHLERLFPKCKVSLTDDADYRFRATLPRIAVADMLCGQLMNIEYPNFKNTIAPADRDYHDGAFGAWTSMHRAQNIERINERQLSLMKRGNSRSTLVRKRRDRALSPL